MTPNPTAGLGRIVKRSAVLIAGLGLALSPMAAFADTSMHTGDQVVRSWNKSDLEQPRFEVAIDPRGPSFYKIFDRNGQQVYSETFYCNKETGTGTFTVSSKDRNSWFIKCVNR